MENRGLFAVNSYFEKRSSRKWTWLHPGNHRGETTITTKNQIFNDVSVINKVKTGSDYRTVRGLSGYLITKLSSRLMDSTPKACPFKFQNSDVSSTPEPLPMPGWIPHNGLVEIIQTMGVIKNRIQKLSECTLKLMAEWSEMKLHTYYDLQSICRNTACLINRSPSPCGMIFVFLILVLIKAP